MEWSVVMKKPPFGIKKGRIIHRNLVAQQGSRGGFSVLFVAWFPLLITLTLQPSHLHCGESSCHWKYFCWADCFGDIKVVGVVRTLVPGTVRVIPFQWYRQKGWDTLRSESLHFYIISACALPISTSGQLSAMSERILLRHMLSCWPNWLAWNLVTLTAGCLILFRYPTHNFTSYLGRGVGSSSLWRWSEESGPKLFLKQEVVPPLNLLQEIQPLNGDHQASLNFTSLQILISDEGEISLFSGWTFSQSWSLAKNFFQFDITETNLDIHGWDKDTCGWDIKLRYIHICGWDK